MEKIEKILEDKLSKLATKEELKAEIFDTKTELKLDLKRITLQLIKNTEDIKEIKENMGTKEEHKQVLDTLDKIMLILKRLDEERITTIGWIRRIDTVVNVHDREIKKIKEKFAIV